MLGAPLNHDFCVISLSDLLTPWEQIKARLRAAVLGDFAIALYNPSSRKRADYLQRACDILLDAGAKETRACGYVENIGRDGETAHTCTLREPVSYTHLHRDIGKLIFYMRCDTPDRNPTCTDKQKCISCCKLFSRPCKKRLLHRYTDPVCPDVTAFCI